MNNKAVIYIHGKVGSADEAERFKPLFSGFDVLGFPYSAETPWQGKEEFTAYFKAVSKNYDELLIIANSIGAYFTMNAELTEKFRQAFFISPVVDMPKLICDMMCACGVDEAQLQREKLIETPFGETLSWEYYQFAKTSSLEWSIPTHVIYGENDNLTSLETVRAFCCKTAATLDIMPGGEHWFHTPEQLAFCDAVIKKYI